MKFFLLTILISSFGFSAEDFDYKKYLKYPEKKSTTQDFSKLLPNKESTSSYSNPGDKVSKFLKKGSVVGFIDKKLDLTDKAIPQPSTPNLERRGLFKKYLKNMKSYFSVEEIDNGKDDLLRLRVFDPEDKYELKQAYYRFQVEGEKKSAVLEVLNGSVYIDLDLSSLPLGEFFVYFNFLGDKIEDNNGKKVGSSNKPQIERYKLFQGEGSFEKIQSQKVFVSFSFEHEDPRGSVFVWAGDTYSTAGDISNYTFMIYSGSSLIDSITTEKPYIFYSIYFPGTYGIEVSATDTEGNSESSERQNVTVSNSSPSLGYKIVPVEGLSGHYLVDLSSSEDKDGDQITSYNLYLLDKESGRYVINTSSEESQIYFVVPERDKEYELSLNIVDEVGNNDYLSIPFIHNSGIAPKYIGAYVSDEPSIPIRKYLGAEFQDDGEIASYNYRAIHEDGSIVNASNPEVGQHQFIELTKAGNWRFEFSAIDNEGLVSDIGVIEREYLWDKSDLIPILEWYYAGPSEEDPRIYYIGSQFRDLLDGSIESYSYRATHENGTVVEADFENIQHNRIRLGIKGTWTIEAYAVDNDGNSSEVHSWQVSVGWSFEKPIANVKIEQDLINPYLFRVTENNSYPQPLSLNKVKATNLTTGHINNFEKTETYFEFELRERGVWQIEYVAVDSFSLESDPVYKLVEIEEMILDAKGTFLTYRKVQIDMSGSYDPERPADVQILYEVIATHEDGDQLVSTHLSDKIEILFPKPGVWKVQINGIDAEYQVLGGTTYTGFGVYNFPPIAYASIYEALAWNSVNLDARGSSDRDGYITSFDYLIKHESGYTLEYSTPNVLDQITLPELEGNWTFTLMVTDNDGKLAEQEYMGSFSTLEPNIKPVGEFALERTSNPYKVIINSSSYDEDGDVVSYKVRALGPSETLELEFSEAPFTLDLSAGFWNIYLKAIDDKGEESNQVSLFLNIKPIELSFKINPTSSRYTYEVDASDTAFTGEISLNIRVRFNGSTVYENQSASIVQEVDAFYASGEYTFSVSASDGTYTTPTQSQTLSVELPSIDGDVIPEDPGSEGMATLEGIDSDNDGVRDDIELWINSRQNLTSLQKVKLKNMSKIMQNHITQVNNKDISIEAKFDEIAYEYCLEYHLGREPASIITNEMRIKFYNTRERLLAWARGEVNFAGQAVVLDTNEEGYEQYCNE